MAEKHQCSVEVSENSRWGAFHSHKCERPVKIEYDGKWYCAIHDPEYVKQKNVKASKKWNEKFNFEVAGAIAQSACKKINPDNPRAVAEAIIPMYEALKLWTQHNQGTRGHYCSDCANAIEKALAKAEGK